MISDDRTEGLFAKLKLLIKRYLFLNIENNYLAIWLEMSTLGPTQNENWPPIAFCWESMLMSNSFFSALNQQLPTKVIFLYVNGPTPKYYKNLSTFSVKLRDLCLLRYDRNTAIKPNKKYPFTAFCIPLCLIIVSKIKYKNLLSKLFSKLSFIIDKYEIHSFVTIFTCTW